MTATSTTTTTSSVATTAHFEIVIEHGKIYLKVSDPCDVSQTLCPVECFVDSQKSNTVAWECNICNCSDVTTPATLTHITAPADLSTTAQIPTTTTNREVVIIGGVAHLLVDFPCTAGDNICPVDGCVIDGVPVGTELCFKCECMQATVVAMTTTGMSSTVTSVTSPGKGSSASSTSDTLDVNGVLHFIVSKPCQSKDNLCPVEGCSVDLKTRGTRVCFQCTCTTTTATTGLPTTTAPSTTTLSALQTVMIAGTEYTMLKDPCTPKDNLCPTGVCHIEAHVGTDKSICFACHC
ncbi:uncharacterized protein LOC135462895 [Liolophura sinensis]|uniref:uncharacterized protein LOC135462895 n=1 Tax=Liolophura sinensis TaxID=3198878 RepID=UPI0031586739